MTPLHPATFEGRPLANPDEPVVDQGLQFDITTLMGRRGLLGLLGGSLGAISLAACGVATPTSPAATQVATPASGAATSGSTQTTTSASLAEIPDETAGPYPGDGSNGPDVLEQSGIVRKDIRSSFGTSTATAAGIPLTLTLSIVDLANGAAPFAGVAVYAWHCTREGGYSMYSNGLENENYLRGVQVAGADGTVAFTTIFPGCYSGRWPHIHFEVYPDQAAITDATKAISTSQVALPKTTCEEVYATTGYSASVPNLSKITLASDNVFGDDSGVNQLATMSGGVSAGYTAFLKVGVDTRTAPTGGNSPGGGQRGPGAASSR